VNIALFLLNEDRSAARRLARLNNKLWKMRERMNEEGFEDVAAEMRVYAGDAARRFGYRGFVSEADAEDIADYIDRDLEEEARRKSYFGL